MARSQFETGEQSDSRFDRRIDLLRVLAEPIRLRLLALLDAGGEVCVCHLHEAVELPQPTVSRHLAVLRDHRLVETRRQGLWVHYRLAEGLDPTTAPLLRAALLGCEDFAHFRADRHRLEVLVKPAALEQQADCCSSETSTIVNISKTTRKGKS